MRLSCQGAGVVRSRQLVRRAAAIAVGLGSAWPLTAIAQSTPPAAAPNPAPVVATPAAPPTVATPPVAEGSTPNASAVGAPAPLPQGETVPAPGATPTLPPAPTTPEPVSGVQASPPGPSAAPVPSAPVPPGQATPPAVNGAVYPGTAASGQIAVGDPEARGFVDRRHHEQRMRWRGMYAQPRIMGLFGLNYSHEFADACPGLSCDVDPPAGGGGGAYVGYGWGNTGVHLLVLGLIDYSGVDVTLPPVTDASGDASGDAGGGFDVNLDDDGLSIGGDLFGSGSASGSSSDDEEPGDVHFSRTGVAFGAGIQHAWFRRPFRVNTGLSAGVVHRTLKGVSSSQDSSVEYNAPFIAGDVAMAFGRRTTFLLGVMGFLEFQPKVTLARNGVFRDVRVITAGPQVFVGPFLGVQWGPRGRPAASRHRPYGAQPGYQQGGYAQPGYQPAYEEYEQGDEDYDEE